MSLRIDTFSEGEKYDSSVINYVWHNLDILIVVQELYPFKPGVSSHLQDLDVYQSTYSFNHKPFNRTQQLEGPFWNRWGLLNLLKARMI